MIRCVLQGQQTACHISISKSRNVLSLILAALLLLFTTNANAAPPTTAPTLGSCACIPCGSASATSNSYSSGTCAPATVSCSQNAAGIGCYSSAGQSCDCSSATVIRTNTLTAAASNAPSDGPAFVGTSRRTTSQNSPLRLCHCCCFADCAPRTLDILCIQLIVVTS